MNRYTFDPSVSDFANASPMGGYWLAGTRRCASSGYHLVTRAKALLVPMYNALLAEHVAGPDPYVPGEMNRFTRADADAMKQVWEGYAITPGNPMGAWNDYARGGADTPDLLRQLIFFAWGRENGVALSEITLPDVRTVSPFGPLLPAPPRMGLGVFVVPATGLTLEWKTDAADPASVAADVGGENNWLVWGLVAGGVAAAVALS